jgi:glycosyltransferase involved in cell wall biosynthesis
MNILFIDQFGELGGGQQCLLELIPAVAERGWRSFAAIPATGDLGTRLSQLGVLVEPISLGEYTSGRKTAADFGRFLMAAPRLVAQLRRLIHRHRIDLVYANAPRVLPAAVMAAGRRPVVFHAHNYLPAGPGRRLVRTSLRIAADPKVIAVSQFVADYVALPIVEIIPNGVADLGSSVLRVNNGAPRIGLIGRIAPEKGQSDFVEAARLLPRGWEFLVAGTPIIAEPSYAQSVRSRASGLPIRFLGWQDDLRHLYSQLDLLAVPSAPGEGFGRVIIEAFSANVPVVAYASGGIGELIEDGVTGYLVEPRTPEALAKKIRSAMEDPEGRSKIARAARTRWQSGYTLAHYRERVTDSIARAASKARTAATSNTGR